VSLFSGTGLHVKSPMRSTCKDTNIVVHILYPMSDQVHAVGKRRLGIASVRGDWLFAKLTDIITPGDITISLLAVFHYQVGTNEALQPQRVCMLGRELSPLVHPRAGSMSVTATSIGA